MTRLLLAAALLVLVGPAPEQPEKAEKSDKEDPVAVAERLYKEGEAKFETADYVGAIESWTDAYAMVPSTSVENAEIKAILISNLAAAHERAYDVDSDLGHLKQAKILLVEYLAILPMLYGETGEELERERVDANERLKRIEEKLAAAAEADAGAGTGGGGEGGTDEPPKPKPTKPFFIAGGVLTGVGVAGLAVGFAGMGIGASANSIGGDAQDDPEARGDQFDRGRAGNVMAIVGSVAGGVLLVTGVALLGVAAKRKSDARKLSVTPALSPSFAGLVVGSCF